MKLITKLVAISSLLVFTSGCLPIAVAVISGVGSSIIANEKHKGDLKKAERVEEYREAVLEGIERIKEATNSKEKLE